jgi:hypothetical protein
VKTKTYDQFQHALSLCLTRRCQEFEDARKEFLERAKKYPTDAIAWYGESVCESEEAHRAIQHAEHCLRTCSGPDGTFIPGATYQTRRELFADIAADFRNSIIDDCTGGSSTSEFSNAAKRRTARGRAKALRDIERLLDHEAI